MKKIRLVCAVLLALQLLAGCAAALVPLTSDPAEKLAWAGALQKQDRPIPAQPLIREAITIYQEQKNEMGLAKAYRAYGLFLTSKAVANWSKFYQEYGFMDQSTYDTRFQKALDYYEKSLTIADKNEYTEMLPNIHLLMASAYKTLQQNDAACSSFNKSLGAHQALKKINPQRQVYVLPGYNSYEGLIEDLKNQTGCKA